jgi:hypothetical protein
MVRHWLGTVVIGLTLGAPSFAAEKLVLDIGFEGGLLSLSHNIDGFLFTPTRNYTHDGEVNLNEQVLTERLRDQLTVTALVRINGEVAGFATEHETVRTNPDDGKPYAESGWFFLLRYPGLNGFLAVSQREDASKVFGIVKRVMEEPEAAASEPEHRVLSTDGVTRVQMATGDLAPYEGGVFEEYNYVTPSDYKNYGEFRAKLQFVIYPAEAGTASAP